MNERIKELAIEAGFYANPDVEKFEKFAELIVQECMLQVADVRIENDFEPVGDAVLVQALAGIKQHFGVEE